MKLKYYLRGLGIGVVVAAVLMGIALGGDKEKLTDAEIMARAKALGMVESSVLADLNKEKENKEPESEANDIQSGEEITGPETEKEPEIETKPQPEDTQEGEETKEGEETTKPESSPEKEPETVPESKQEDNQSEQEQTNVPQEEYVTLVIERGESSVSVSRSLAELGLVESAKEYDRFLCSNGYDKYIRVGTHKIKVGSTDEEIANIISRKKN